MNKIKKFYQEHKETVISGGIVLGAVILTGIAEGRALKNAYNEGFKDGGDAEAGVIMRVCGFDMKPGGYTMGVYLDTDPQDLTVDMMSQRAKNLIRNAGTFPLDGSAQAAKIVVMMKQ